MNKAILSVLGQDRPGIVAGISGVLSRQQCNIENVSQTILQSQFAGIFIVSTPPDLSLEALEGRLIAEMQALNMSVQIKGVQDQDAPTKPADSEPFVITTEGPDRIGLVAGITEIIAQYGANITNLQAVFKGGDAPGDNIMIYEVDIPLNTDQKAFDSDLRQRATELSLDISIQHRNIFEAINRI
jgi:glycine cleavage system transcriptional repressor